MTLFVPLDLETTGLDPDNDHILEISWTVTDAQFNPVTPLRTHLVEHTPEEWSDIWGQLKSNEFVRNMHQESGLINDLQTKAAWHTSGIVLQLIDDIQLAAVMTNTELEQPVPFVHLTGLSIAFDREFLKRDSNLGLVFDNNVLGFQFHHRLLDLTSVKLMLDTAGVPWERVKNERGHRAINDVQEVVDQVAVFQRTLSSLAVV